MEIKRFLSDNQVDYVNMDITQDAKAKKQLVTEYKSRSVPTTVIGETVVVGFNESELRKLLDL